MRLTLIMVRRELLMALRRPLFWVFLILTLLFSILYYFGGVQVSVGSGGRAADEVVHLNGPYYLTIFYMAVPFVVATLFAAVAMATSVIRDQQLGVEDVLRSTHLSARGYVLGKLFGTGFWVLGIVLLGLFIGIVMDQVTAGIAAGGGMDKPEAFGAASPVHHLHPFLFHSLPWIAFAMAGAFYLGVRTRAPLVIYGSLALLYISVLWISDFEPQWIQDWSKNVLGLEWAVIQGWIDPSGISWLIEEYGREDRGVAFYNSEIPALTTGIAMNRVVLLLLAGLALWRSMAIYSRQKHGRLDAAREAVVQGDTGDRLGLPDTRAIAALSKRGLVAGTMRVMRAELALLRRQPSVWIFVPLIWTFTIAGALIVKGPWDSQMIVTATTASSRLASLLALWTCGFGACLAIEALHRERVQQIAGMFFSTPVKSGALVLGKILAVTGVMLFIIVGAALITGVFQAALHGTVPRPDVYALSLGVLLLPGVLFFIALASFLTAFLRSRMGAYACLIVFSILYAIGLFTGWLDWRGKVIPTSLVVHSDITGLRPYVEELLLNRVLVGCVTLVLLILTVLFFPRTDRTRTERVSWRRLRRGKLALVAFAALIITAIGSSTWLARNMNQGLDADWREDRIEDYALRNRARWGREDVALPEYSALDFDIEFFPDERRFALGGRFDFVNLTEQPITVLPLTMNLDWEIEPEGHIFLSDPANGGDDEPRVKDRNGLYEVRLPEPLLPNDEVSLWIRYDGAMSPGARRASGGFEQWILEDAIFVHTFPGQSIIPAIGYLEPDSGDTDTADDELNEGQMAEHYHDDHASSGGAKRAMDVAVRVTVPDDLTAICVGNLLEKTVADGKATFSYRTDHPVYFYALMAGRFEQKSVGDCTVYYHPDHDQNIDDIATALDQSRRFYSAIFSAFPFEELRIVEFPRVAGFAMGFPTLIPFSELLGFLTRSDDGISNINFMVTAHEVAHQWWGTITWPAEVPGSPFLTEALAHYSTLLMEERFNGRVAGRNRRLSFERAYLSGRRKDVERPVVRIDGSEPGDQVTWYNKGGLVFWMTSERIGRDNLVQALRDYVVEFSFQEDHPTIHDLLRHIRAKAGPGHEEFLRQTFYEVVLPRPEIVAARVSRSDRGYSTTVELKNNGTGTVSLDVEVANRGLLTGEIGAMPAPIRLARDDLEDPLGWVTEAEPAEQEAGDAPDEETEPYLSVRKRVTLAAGESLEIQLDSEFEPGNVLLDPDAQVLMQGRNQASRKLGVEADA